MYSLEFQDMRKKIIEKFKKNKKFNQEDYLTWLNLFIFLSLFKFSLEIKNSKVKKIVYPVKVIDIFINLPDTHNFINFSNKLDKEFWKTNQEYAIDTIFILSKHTDDNLKKLLIEMRNFFMDLPEVDLSYEIDNNKKQEVHENSNLTKLLKYYRDLVNGLQKEGIKNEEINKKEIKMKENDFKIFNKLLKGIAIENNQNEINANVVFTAISYLDLSPYGKAVFSKMIGDNFYRIMPSTGGQKYIDLADNNEDIPFDGNMQIFINELKKHLENEEFFTIR